MALDFESLKNPEWIAKREEQWKVFEDFYGDEWTKKDRQHYKEYFFTGNLNKYQIPILPQDAIRFFPIQNIEGHGYAVNRYSKIEWTPEKLASFINLVFLSRAETALSIKETVELFTAYVGKEHDPNRLFPFLIGDETAYRAFAYSPERLLYEMLENLTYYFKHVGFGIKESKSPHLLDFMFSLFRAVNPTLFKNIFVSSSVEGLSLKIDRSSDYYRMSRYVRDLMCYVFTKHLDRKAHAGCQDLLSEKFRVLSEIEHHFESMATPEYPAELIEHWQHIKSRNILIEISFSVDDEIKKNWRDFLLYWFVVSRMELDSTSMERSDIGLEYNQLSDRFIKMSLTHGDLFFNSWELDWDTDVKFLTAVFSSKTIEISNELESFFKTLPVENLTFKVTKIR
jgi:hypothetical protein